MRLRTISIAMLLAVTGRMCAQQIDPALTAAVVAQTAILNDVYNTRDNTQKKIIAAEAAVTVAMERMHLLRQPQQLLPVRFNYREST